MKTKNLLIAVMAILFVSLSFTNCKKEKSTTVNKEERIDLAFVDKARQWLEEKRNALTGNKKLLVDTLISKIEWNHYSELTLNESETLIIVAINDSFKTINITTKKTEKNLVLLVDKKGAIVKGNIIELIPTQATTGQSSSIVIPEIYKNRANSYTGFFSILSITNQLVYEMEYQNGKLYSQRFAQPKYTSRTGGRAGSTNAAQGCIDWFWEYYVNGVLVYEEYAYSTCSGPEDEQACRSFRTIDARNAFTSGCGGGGNGGISIVNVDSIINLLLNPCFVNTVSGIQAAKFKNQIVKLFDETYVGAGFTTNLKFVENSNLYDVYGYKIAAKSSNQLGIGLWTIELNPTYGTNVSREYWGSVIIHELVHSFITIYKSQGVNLTQFEQHEIVFDKWIRQMSDFLVQSYNIDPLDAMSLSLGGLDDVLKEETNGDLIFKDKYERMAKRRYDIELTDAEALRDLYKNGTKGIVCN